MSTQTRAWSFAYLAFMGMTLWCAWPILAQKLNQYPKQPPVETKTPTRKSKRSTPLKAPGWFDRVTWMLLAACGSVVLLAVTNQMCQDVAVIPFLWVVPLSLYLITFIICFERDTWYQRKIWIPFLALGVGVLVYLLGRDYADGELSLAYQIVIYCAAMFGCCMVCHGEMVRRRPTAGDLTLFYVYVALGGALGGVFVNLIAPLLFDGFWETAWQCGFCLFYWPFCFVALDHDAMNFLLRSLVVTVGVVGVGALIWFLGMHISEQRDTSILNKRSFFGVLHVYEKNKGTPLHYRSLRHGRIKHGEQWQHKLMRDRPTSYFGPRSGAGLALNRFPSRKK